MTVDTQRADRVSAHDSRRDPMPRLESLAADGVLYRHAVSPASWTLPAHASRFTGLLPTEHGAHQPPTRKDGEEIAGVRPPTALSEDHLLLAEIVREAGYRTGAVVASDYGEFFGEHLLWRHGVGPFEPGHQRPQIVKPPSGGGGQEEEDLAGLEPERTAELREALERFVRGTKKGARENNGPAKRDSETRRRLHALEYIH